MIYMSILDSYVIIGYDVIMNSMTDSIREMVRESMNQQGISTYRLAQLTEIEQPNVTARYPIAGKRFWTHLTSS
jgi:hypothetical protein